MASVSREEFDELKALVETLAAKLEKLENNGSKTSVKKTPKSKTEPVALEEYLEAMNNGKYSCSYCPKTGKSADKFCNSTNKLHFKGVEITEELSGLKNDDYYQVRCSLHHARSTNKANDRGANLIKAHYGKINDNTVVAKSEEEPETQLSQILTGNTVDVITTPSKAMSKKEKNNEHYIPQGEFLDEVIKRDEGTVIVRYHSSINGTPKRKPSPVILGVCSEFDETNYLENLEAPSDKIKASLDLKYSPIKKVEPVEEKHMPKVKTTDDLGSGLTMPSTEDAYEAKTDNEEDEDITALLDDLKK